MCKADNLTTILTVVMKSGNLNLLEPSGPLQACNGTALPLPFTYKCSDAGSNFHDILSVVKLYDLEGRERNDKLFYITSIINWMVIKRKRIN